MGKESEFVEEQINKCATGRQLTCDLQLQESNGEYFIQKRSAGRSIVLKVSNTDDPSK